MKLKTTKKQIQGNFHRIAQVGYCEAQHILKYRSPFAYSCGVYGWNGDYYEVDGVCIATGYRSLPNNQNTKVDYASVRKFDERAREAKGEEATEAILKEFIAEITINQAEGC